MVLVLLRELGASVESSFTLLLATEGGTPDAAGDLDSCFLVCFPWLGDGSPEERLNF